MAVKVGRGDGKKFNFSASKIFKYIVPKCVISLQNQQVMLQFWNGNSLAFKDGQSLSFNLYFFEHKAVAFDFTQRLCVKGKLKKN